MGQTIEDPPEASLPVRPKPPAGVGCVIYGKGTDLEPPCNDRLTAVSSSRFGGRPLAQFARGSTDVAWGIYSGRGRGWVHIEDDTFILDGFSDLSKETFALLREVDVVSDHVWLKHGIPVNALGADRGGVLVRVEAEVDGLAEVGLRVPCDALLFDPAPAPPATDPAAAPPIQPETTLPRFTSLSLHTEPGGPLLTTLRSKNIDPKEGVLPMPLFLDVVERRDDWTRVRFEIDVARFDVWSPTLQLDGEVASGFGTSGFGCGGSGRGPIEAVAVVRKRTPVIVGERPGFGASRGLALTEGAKVIVVERHAGFVSVVAASSSIYPPEGEGFWVPASSIDED